MILNDKQRRRLILAIGLFILPFQLAVNHFCGGITIKSLIVILIGWVISLCMLFLIFHSICKR